MKLFKAILPILTITLLTACHHAPISKRDMAASQAAGENAALQNESTAAGDMPTFQGSDGLTAQEAQMQSLGQERQFNAQKDLLKERVLLFAFDSNKITPLFRETIEAHGHYLLDHPNIVLKIEGHTDERGTNEYNIALGERRAQAVARVLFAMGIGRDRVKLVSYGEERPADIHHNETAWQKNRRAVIVYG